MIAQGMVLLLVGAALIAAEAHVPGGVLGAVGGIAAVVGCIVLIGALGGGAVLAVPVAVTIGLVAASWTLLATRTAASVRGRRARAGGEALCGRVGVVRQWDEPVGQIFVEGALWRARRDWGETDPDALSEGDRVVVERVDGLTLAVRRAEEWELIA